MTLTIEPESTDEAMPVARLIRVMRYEHAELGGGPVIDLGGIHELAIGSGESDRVSRDRAETADPSMSRQHAVLRSRGSFLFDIEDRGSKNGTFVNGVEIKAGDRVALQDGSLVEMGRTAWILRIAPAHAPEHVMFGPTRSFSPKIFAIASRLDSVAPTNIPVLLSGETGTGKEVFARELHARSGRRGRFIAVNCGALSESLIESELFGHKKGAFTGATESRVGHVEAADGGTLLLDEIGDMPLAAQVRLLRVLQESEIVPLGESTPRKVDVRIVAASHRDLAQMIDEERFRGDLYARLNGIALEMPRLFDRREDIGEIVASVAALQGQSVRIGVSAARALMLHTWPFNVRELVRVSEAAIVQTRDGRIERAHLPERIMSSASSTSSKSTPPSSTALSPEDEALKNLVVEALDKYGGNVTRAAESLGKKRQQMQRWMRRFGLGGGSGDDE